MVMVMFCGNGGENVVELGRVAGDSMKCELYVSACRNQKAV